MHCTVFFPVTISLSAYAMFGGPPFQDATSDIYTFESKIFDFSSFAIIYNVLDHFPGPGTNISNFEKVNF